VSAVDGRALLRAIGASPAARVQPGSHGHWSSTWRVVDGARTCFVKTAATPHAALLDAERAGLTALGDTFTVRVPRVLGHGDVGGTRWLMLEWLDLRPLDAASARRLGRDLAALHAAPAWRGPHGERYGFAADNFIGATPQANGWSDEWIALWREQRLRPQLDRAASRRRGAALQRQGERVLERLDTLLRDHVPEPSLLHGDLWAGNAGALPDGTPVVFDPAVYVGDREADLAMTELFGGFGAPFARAYRAALPPAPGYEMRRDLYNLYHLLNHLNLFGDSYLAQCERLASRLLAP